MEQAKFEQAKVVEDEAVEKTTQEELIEELENYQWLGNKDGVPMDAYNHCIDAWRYIVTYLNNDRDTGEYHVM